jgi:hypothetical protein
MSRSCKRTPICGMTRCKSEKHDKQLANRKVRASACGAMSADSEIVPTLWDVSSVWPFGKDGRQWLGNRHLALLRK